MLTQGTQERWTAYETLTRVEKGGAYSNIALREALRPAGLDARQRAFCSALVYGVLERKLTLDRVLTPFLSRPISKLDPQVLCILRLGVYQLLYMDSVPAPAAVDQCVALCRRAGKQSAAGFINGVLRSFVRAGCPVPPPKGDLFARMGEEYSAPRRLAELLCRSYGEENARLILENTLVAAPLAIRVNTLKTDAAALRARLDEEGAVSMEGPDENALLLSGVGNLEELPSFRAGLFHVQDVSSQLCARALDARPGMRVLDCCAAPGGKSFTAAQMMENRGEIFSCDLHPHKTALIGAGARRLGIDIIVPLAQDAAVTREGWGLFDRVLCDVPCSGLGVIRRRPEIKYKDFAAFDALPEVQYKILENSANYCKPGGLLVYSTCTLNPAENERVVERFLGACPAFSESAAAALGGEWKKTVLPLCERDGDGFFVAVLRRAGEGA